MDKKEYLKSRDALMTEAKDLLAEIKIPMRL